MCVTQDLGSACDHCCLISPGCLLSYKLRSLQSCSSCISPVAVAGVAAVIQLWETHSLTRSKYQQLRQRLFLWVKWHRVLQCVHVHVSMCMWVPRKHAGGDYSVAARCVSARPSRVTHCNHRRLLLSGNQVCTLYGCSDKNICNKMKWLLHR